MTTPPAATPLEDAARVDALYAWRSFDLNGLLEDQGWTWLHLLPVARALHVDLGRGTITRSVLDGHLAHVVNGRYGTSNPIITTNWMLALVDRNAVPPDALRPPPERDVSTWIATLGADLGALAWAAGYELAEARELHQRGDLNRNRLLMLTSMQGLALR